jgi:hypothetical protein
MPLSERADAFESLLLVGAAAIVTIIWGAKSLARQKAAGARAGDSSRGQG